MRLGASRALVDGDWVDGDVEVLDGRVAAVGVGEPRGSKLAAPGFVDLQVNGYAGVDFSRPGEEGFARAGAALLADGVTAFQPTLVTSPVREMVESLATVGGAAGHAPTDAAAGASAATPAAGAGMPRIVGAHLEGPFLSRERAGAHDRDALLAPEPALLDRLLAAGPVSQVTLAPELPGALDLVDALVARGVTVSCGHTEADAAAAHAAFDRGASAVTHLFNAMRRPEHRDPGIAYAALGREDVFITLIADGHHLADDTVRAAARAAGDHLVLISDAVAAAAAPDGDYTLGGNLPIHSERGVVRSAAGSLAGSTLTMPAAVRNLHALGVPLAAALRAATEAPARMARRPDLGRLDPGARADLVVLDDSLEPTQVLLAGVPQH
ncbi:MAG: N-acetylglucosamine-6-phosphate deacetylase [Solirubrobacterales bacterium 70-9]|nr:MAG: N-acetylglucosamine-6-phosphate deacetylase [Solirubrobacterales bacterium 70-9]